MVSDNTVTKGLRFKVNFANRERYRKSTIPYLQRMLNSCESEKEKIIRNIEL